MKEGRVQIATVLSGSGSDNESVLKAHAAGLIPNADIVGIIGTAYGLEGFNKAQKLGYMKQFVVDHEIYKGISFQGKMAELVTKLDADLLLALGCKWKLPVISGVKGLNIHPQDTDEHGGYHMVGLESHKHFLTHEVQDLIYRGRKKVTDPFYVTITIHEINPEWDDGRPFLRYDVKIRTDVIDDFISERVSLEASAVRVQAFVLEHEHRVLPYAANLAVQEILSAAA